MLTKEGNGKEEMEEPHHFTTKATNNPLPAAPPDSVFILPMPAAQPNPQASTTKATPSLLVLQNIRKLVANRQTFATTSKAQAATYTAWHSGWFGCGFGFGAPEPRHFQSPPLFLLIFLVLFSFPLFYFDFVHFSS